ncbi:M56 family metallopeptidase [Formosa sp. S-31]|uniref:M56 family metallopeptidase n=1 Tax=Formosa sp. S-31 TaxID=2790949 RepID=UPI003EB7583D
MDYLLKGSGLIALFYLFYMLWLQKETFFNANRWFLLSGLALSIGMPLVVIPIYIEAASPILNLSAFKVIAQPDSSYTFSVMEVLFIIYCLGVLFFSLRFILELNALKNFIKNQELNRHGRFQIAKTKENLAPFSFFNWIFYHPNTFTKDELIHIINHEKVHARQLHSIDILVAKIATIVFWFNPFIWFYKKALIQNLEFIADGNASEESKCTKTYQNLLLKTSLPAHQLALTNNFYNSLIKKRIIMLHKSNSSTINQFKYLFIVPLLAAFLMSFNTKTVYKTPANTPHFTSEKIGEFTAVITKDDTDAQLDAIISSFQSQNVTLKIKHVKRNSNNEITKISIEAKSETSTVKFNSDSDNPIDPIKISFNSSTQNLQIFSAKQNSDIVFTSSKNANIVNTDSDNAFVIHTSDGSNSFVIKKTGEDDKDHNVMFISEDGKTTHVTSTTDEVKWEYKTEDTLSNTINTTVEKHIFRVKSDDDKTPIFIVDGKRISKAEMEAIDPDNIEFINVYKGDKATEKYGEDAKDGVVDITLKK